MDRTPWGDPKAGEKVIGQMACGSCHEIPGIWSADARVGPSLVGLARRKLIAGKLPNSRPNLESYLLDPQRAVPGNYMPDQNLTPRQAADIAAYLLKSR